MVGRDKKKEFAPSCAAFYPLGADLFLSPRKIDHIARFVQIPAINVPGDVPSILIVNIQVTSIFPSFRLNLNSEFIILITVVRCAKFKLDTQIQSFFTFCTCGNFIDNLVSYHNVDFFS